MSKLLLSLDEVDRVRRINGLQSYTALEDKTGITRKTWSKVLRTRELSTPVMEALHDLGARPSKLLVSVEIDTQFPTAA
ncbi:hypothetical protein YH66_09810 [[Brevibacterium] flavum]|uniref:HTH cro/C1-type domain-containing protein n=1 Tax=[Brevibacterium] flavum TaxID=92706 RepID=A0A0F6Z713_9CORY|nr:MULTISPECIES: hypothetical protein [Corynebacterium]AKF27822.1 hypothetical protein YH66_09810 [[Brevibacterium] flavum]ANE08656.1 hypothetical protein A3654_09870 [Corynebacterium glutamicum]AST21069.1 transcriptional regulator [Corynebacterium glutamicum ATCC 14067]KEI23579.1 hypothetical protein KIQ_013735 [Corynebacterium glutamicum ATCC 14067]KIH73324.1 hypothetical protein SD36_09840 [Corynebacterium glutamicum]